MKPPYAWTHDVESENQATILAAILTKSFKQSGTKIKDTEAIMSAARHIVQSERVVMTIK